MAGDVRNPFGDLKGYQFWAIFGGLVVIAARVLLAYDVPLGPFTILLWEDSLFSLYISDVIGFLLASNAYFDYRKFLNQSTT